ncbi:accessory factor UbiK family protein [Gammaproteobacteria bacterium]|jgi:BMFP domain-containing protein YqiC|nr:accessory factor UbiK family protein [Gammaproteobacteria bacterium]MDA9258285.1 accessory factor UbiK family protein [Gammaproteobacteria bacterium]MDB9897231.1 accessory factor UbiK family protein [Gammaproteobacteria bacterium]MDB9909958.1 accessory factor UbiK family protein [Gammaproteobacteria bacterium]
MANKDTFEAFISIVQDKIMDFTDGSSKPNFKAVKDEVREKFDELIRSQGYVSKEEFEALEAIAKRLESRLDELEAKTK